VAERRELTRRSALGRIAGVGAASLGAVLLGASKASADWVGGWKFCVNCYELCMPVSNTWCAGGSYPNQITHNYQGWNFYLPYGEIYDSSTLQTNWYECGRCHALFFAGWSEHAGQCEIEPHFIESWHRKKLAVPHSLGGEVNGYQSKWRYCGSCGALFWSGDPNRPRGRCVANKDGHLALGYEFYVPTTY
jgi:hypothetical protein